MRKVELLAPAGSIEALYAAVNCGADAIYLGGNKFGARAFATNFTNDNLIEAVKFCHIRGVKIYVTVNTLLYEHELDSALEYVKFLYDIQVDALIVQDFGLFTLIGTNYPDFEIHCSTQMHIHNVEGAKFMAENGASRIVLARESSLDMISNVCKQNIDVEAFVYGAHCVCYSGQCLMSSFNGNRSGNRGECAQPCRLPYQLRNDETNSSIQCDGDFLLSPKDLFTIDQIPKLIKAGIHSFKIEGRMKKVEYVSQVISLYRKAIDAYYLQDAYTISKSEIIDLKKVFSRGFTSGHLFSQKGFDFINPIRPNHVGIEIGHVISVSKVGVKIKLTSQLAQNDGIRILNNNEDQGLMVNMLEINDLLVNKGEKGDEVLVYASKYLGVKKGDVVLKTTDYLQSQRLEKMVREQQRKVSIDMQFTMNIGKPFCLSLSDGHNIVECYSTEIVSKAIKAPVTFSKIIELLSKTNESAYNFKCVEYELDDNIFISLKTINDLRRQVIEKLDLLRVKANRVMVEFKPLKLKNTSLTFNKIASFNNLEQLEALKNKEIELFYTDYDICQKHHLNYMTSSVNEVINYFESNKIIIQELGMLSQYQKHGCIIASSSFNVTNSYAVQFLLNNNVDAIILSNEISDKEISLLAQAFYQRHNFYPNIGSHAYGKRQVMISKYCVVNTMLSNGLKQNCSLCKKNRFSLINQKNEEYRISSDSNCNSLIFEKNIYNNLYNLNKHLNFTYLTFLDENKSDIDALMI